MSPSCFLPTNCLLTLPFPPFLALHSTKRIEEGVPQRTNTPYNLWAPDSLRTVQCTMNGDESKQPSASQDVQPVKAEVLRYRLENNQYVMPLARVNWAVGDEIPVSDPEDPKKKITVRVAEVIGPDVDISNGVPIRPELLVKYKPLNDAEFAAFQKLEAAEQDQSDALDS